MELAKLIKIVRTLAPEHLAEKWDKVGLHLGDPGQTITKALLCIDFTPAVLQEALKFKAQLILAYHPPIFAPLNKLTEDDWKQKLLIEAVRHHLAVYSPHTALDAVPGGLNDWWCDALGRGVRRAIVPHESVRESGGLHKIITFVPGKAADRVRQAMSDAGAGCIGAYSECSFFNEGTGTFRGSAGTHPTIGIPGRLEKVPKIRLEMVCPADVSVAVQQALLQTHPYEEPAFDVYPLLPPLRRDVPETPPVTGASLAGTSAIGAGRILQLDKPVKLHTLLERLQAKLGKAHLVAHKPVQARSRVERIGICVGAGGSLLAGAMQACDGKLDVFFTGEMRHHDVLDAVQRGVTVVLAGHTQTERPYLPVYRDRLKHLTGSQVHWQVSKADIQGL